jgi:hypothetical protein
MFNWKRQGPTVCAIVMLSKEEEKETIQGRPASQVLYLHDKELLLVLISRRTSVGSESTLSGR